MGKHNANGTKSRKSGQQVGVALQARAAKVARNKGADPTTTNYRHTTDVALNGPNMQSVLERNDLDELLAIADLADRDFTAERGQVLVISTGAVDPLDVTRSEEARRVAEAKHAHRMRLPRRPTWTAETTPEQLDLQERTSFLEWRRGLAKLEEEEQLVLTPFEKNLEVWRQLWRVLEKSDIVVQVVDARDPLLYRSDDLEEYARSLDASKSSLILLNKADLLPEPVRALWADFFESVGVDYAFFSAFAEMEEQTRARAAANAMGQDPEEAQAEARRRHAKQAAQQVGPLRTRLLDADELLHMFEEKAREAVESAGPDDPRNDDPERRLMVGLVGYPNVGKSSTINALFGSKKTAVAPTPGKTKHFQTLFVSPTVCLCDCPGLVLPRYAKSKSEMVAAGVIPIDRLTDIREPVEVLASRVGRRQLEAVYGVRLPPPAAHEPNKAPTAAQLLRALGTLHGWTNGSGLPDETRAGRVVMRDYMRGKLLYCTLPPGSPMHAYVPLLHELPGTDATSAAAAGGMQQRYAGGDGAEGSDAGSYETVGTSDDEEDDDSEGEDAEEGGAGGGVGRDGGCGSGDDDASGSGREDEAAEATSISHQAEPGRPTVSSTARPPLDAADADLLANLDLSGSGKKQPKRPAHKFHMKPARTKGTRGYMPDGGGYDGAAMTTGRKGGINRFTNL